MVGADACQKDKIFTNFSKTLDADLGNYRLNKDVKSLIIQVVRP